MLVNTVAGGDVDVSSPQKYYFEPGILLMGGGDNVLKILSCRDSTKAKMESDEGGAAAAAAAEEDSGFMLVEHSDVVDTSSLEEKLNTLFTNVRGTEPWCELPNGYYLDFLPCRPQLVGLKIHISAIKKGETDLDNDGNNILKLVLQYLLSNNINHKVVMNSYVMKTIFNVLEIDDLLYSQRGKLITIYTNNTDHFKEIITTLFELLSFVERNEFNNPPYNHIFEKRQCISFRYGQFTSEGGRVGDRQSKITLEQLLKVQPTLVSELKDFLKDGGKYKLLEST
jgi:hypothetical protein